MESVSDQPRLIDGGVHEDNRGSLAFFNEFSFTEVERFYVIRPERPRTVRGWTGHQRERKWFTAVEGTITVAVVRPDDWQSPDPHIQVTIFTLSAGKPQILVIPPGHATAIVGVSPRSALIVFSTGTINQAPSDNYRFPPDFWKIPESKLEA